MSGSIALAKPRRIKAAHRRRRKVASGQSVQRYYDPGIGRFLSVDPVTAYGGNIRHFNRYAYTYNNPYSFTDPDGRCPEGSKPSECIQSAVRVDKSDVKLSADGESFATSNAGRNSVDSNKASEETVKAGVRNADGKIVARSLSDVKKSESAAGHSAKGTLPEGAEFVIHGHVNKTQIDQPGLGDSQPPLDANMPNVAVSGDGRVGVREIEGGYLQHRMLRGSMSQTEYETIQQRMNEAASQYNDR